MSTRTAKNTLKRMSKDRSFRIEERGDSHYGIAEGFKAKRLMIRGSKTAAGLYLSDKGVHLPTDAINRTVRTFSEATASTRSRNQDRWFGSAKRTDA